MRKRKFIIFSPPYNPKQGGVICLHKLAHLINLSGDQAYLFPAFENIEISRRDILVPILRLGRDFYRKVFERYKTNSYFNTPIYDGKIKDLVSDEYIVIYYEQVFGNPLGARNIVRWLLHRPGYHTGKVYYGFNELLVPFHNSVADFFYPHSKQSGFVMSIIHYPLEMYNMDGAMKKRIGTAYCIRKGKGKKIEHNQKDSVLIDNLPHADIARIFKRVKTFVSYDTYTAYSRLAALCGCDSVVIPDPGVTEEEWFSNPDDRLGLAYGFENIEKARKTRAHLFQKIQDEHQKSFDDVKTFKEECYQFFNQKRYAHFREKHVRKYNL